MRVRLVAEEFRPSVTTVMWMHQELGLDIGCVRIGAWRLPDGSAVVSSRLVLPPLAAEDYLVGVRRREGEEERLRRARPARKPNAVPRLLAAGAIPAGAKLQLRLHSLTQKEQDLVGPLLEEEPSVGTAEWTDKTPNMALRWAKDGGLYTATGAVVKVLQLSGARSESDGGSAHGPTHWELVGDGRTLWEIAEALPEADGEGDSQAEDRL